MNPLRFLWEWKPTNIWEQSPDFIVQWQESVLLWIGNQVSELVRLTSSLLLSFPTHFLETPQFQQLYALVLMFALVFLPACMAYRILRAVMGNRRWAFVDQRDVILFVVRFFVLVAVVLKAPQVFIIFSRLANQIVAILLGASNFNLAFYPRAMGLEIILISLLIIIVFYSIRIIIYYAVRNFQLIVLILTTPVVLVRWVIFGDSHRVETWLNQFLGLLIVQVLHAFILVVLARLVGLEPSEANGKLTKVWAAMVQIGAMELMLRPELILGHIVSFQSLDQQLQIQKTAGTVTKQVKKLIGGGKVA